MMKAWLKLSFGLMACFFLISYGTCIAQTEEQTQTQDTTQQVQEQATPEETQSAQQQEASPQPKSGELPVPLEAEMVVAAHWSKNPYPRTVAAGARVHIVERRDTLWDLAQRYYGNPFLWPQIWDANKYIPNAHWIYPGDPVIIPPLDTNQRSDDCSGSTTRCTSVNLVVLADLPFLHQEYKRIQ